MPKKITCDKCNKKEEYSYLVYNKEKYCSNCIFKMLKAYSALPNDGTLSGGILAHDLETASKTRINKFFKRKDNPDLIKIL